MLCDVAEDAGEVPVAAADVAAAGAVAQSTLGSDEIVEVVIAVGANEVVHRDVGGEVVGGVQLLQEELAGAALGAGAFARLRDDVGEVRGVAVLERVAQAGSPCVVDAQVDGQKQRESSPRERGGAQRGDDRTAVHPQ